MHQAELPVFRAVAERAGLPRRDGADAWQRHPLAFLTEAADDIAYRIIDFEDGLRLGLVERDRFIALLAPLCAGEPGAPDRLEPLTDREAMFDLALTLRGVAVGRLIREAADVFATRQAEIACASPQLTGPAAASSVAVRSIVMSPPAISIRTRTATGVLERPSLSSEPSAS